MLKKQINDQKNYKVADFIWHYLDSIDGKEKQMLIDIIFSLQTPRIKILPFDYNWCIKPDFLVVTNALVKLSSIVIELKGRIWQDNSARMLQNYMNSIYKLLKDGLIAHGCDHPPWRIDHETQKPNYIKDLAAQVVALRLQPSEELDVFVEGNI